MMNKPGEEHMYYRRPVRPVAQPHHHGHERKPADLSYRVVVRAILWVIAGAVLVGFAIWWIVT
jgi:hypothetical protein